MKSFTTPDFWRAYAALPAQVKQNARKAYLLWQENQSHPSLHFKKVGKNLWSVRITGGYRALALKKEMIITGSGLGHTMPMKLY